MKPGNKTVQSRPAVHTRRGLFCICEQCNTSPNQGAITSSKRCHAGACVLLKNTHAFNHMLETNGFRCLRLPASVSCFSQAWTSTIGIAGTSQIFSALLLPTIGTGFDRHPVNSQDEGVFPAIVVSVEEVSSADLHTSRTLMRNTVRKMNSFTAWVHMGPLELTKNWKISL